ncbi:hypothetical protein D3C86_2137220 [compost metagenome]
MGKQRPHKNQIIFLKIADVIANHAFSGTFIDQNKFKVSMVMPGSREEIPFFPENNKGFVDILR